MDFVPNITGTLIRLEEDENSRFRFEVWFDYTKRAMNLIREGAMLAVPNFASNSDEQHMSILEVVSILPMHYALGDDARGYPGFVVEAAKSAVNDWEEQETESTEDVTKIRCIAIPTNFEVVQSTRPTGEKPNLREESNLPMVGASVHLLDTEFTEYVANYGIREDENTIIAGALIRDPNVRIRVRVEDLLRTHFGVFGFTGAGKSNLVSTLVSRILTESQETVKIVIFDLMGEYIGLLIDQLCELSSAKIICLDERSVPDQVARCLNGENALLDEAAEVFSRTALLPKALKPHTRDFAKALKRLITDRKIKLWRLEEDLTVSEAVREGNPWGSRQKGHKPYNEISAIVGSVFGKYYDTEEKLTPDLAGTLLDQLRAHPRYTEYEADFRNLVSILFRVIKSGEGKVAWAISIDELVNELNSSDRSTLYLIQSHDPHLLREFAHRFGEKMYDARRKSGTIAPLVSFIFDEADEFIPRDASGSYEKSRDIAMTLARRGRKFGLGIGIATQRVRYLDTSIMAQPHTYFVSKMPRQSDRQVVAEAFGVSEDMFRQTFKFKKGDWLLMSYDATGLEAIPIPIHCEDANERVKEFLERINRGVASSGARTR